VLNAELQQIGLPKENSDGVSRPYRIHRERISAQAAEDSLRLPRLWSLEWRTAAVVYDSVAGELRGGATATSSFAGVAGGVPREGAVNSAVRHGHAPVPVHHLRLGMSHTSAQAYPKIPASAASETPLLLLQAGAQPLSRESSDGALEKSPPALPLMISLDLRPLPLTASASGLAAEAGAPSAGVSDAHPARAVPPPAAAYLAFSAGQAQVTALLAELCAARSALSALADGLEPSAVAPTSR
jgi:hypothetical protein